jgi:hypothetical protein
VIDAGFGLTRVPFTAAAFALAGILAVVLAFAPRRRSEDAVACCEALPPGH